VAQILTFDLQPLSRLSSCITAARENARQVREEISTPTMAAAQLPVSPGHPSQIEQQADDALPSDFLLP
jgi:uncharacterized alpha-E superfamily protein